MILIVDDDHGIANAIGRLCRNSAVLGVQTITDALSMADKISPTAIVLDAWVGQDNGLNYIKELSRAFGGVPILVFTGLVNDVDSRRAKRDGAYAYIQKTNIWYVKGFIDAFSGGAAPLEGSSSSSV